MSVTLKDLARELNLNVSTVSRALREDARIAPATRERIQLLARQMRYRPNLLARSLAGGETRTVWLILPRLVSEHDSRLACDAVRAASFHRYDMLLALHDEESALLERLTERLTQGAADGALVESCGPDAVNDSILRLLSKEFPLVFLSRRPEACEADLVLADHAVRGERMARACSAAGARYFVFPLAQESLGVGQRAWFDGAAGEILRLGHPYDSAADGRSRWKTRFLSEGVAVLAPTQRDVREFVAANRREFHNKALFAGVFEDWVGGPEPAQKAFVCRPDTKELCRQALERLILRIKKQNDVSAETIKTPPLGIETIGD